MTQVHHMVILKFKSEVSDAAIAEVLQEVKELKESIPGINHCSIGAYSSSEGLNQGFTHGFLMTFESTEARDHYLLHSNHEIVKNALFAILEDAIAFDFIAG